MKPTITYRKTRSTMAMGSVRTGAEGRRTKAVYTAYLNGTPMLDIGPIGYDGSYWMFEPGTSHCFAYAGLTLRAAKRAVEKQLAAHC